MQATHQRSINWRTLLLEAFFIVLGVMLALGANDLREQRNNVRDAATALESIRDELAAWQTANVTGTISYMAYDDVLLLSRIYESQRQYYDQQKLVGQNIYTTFFNEGYAGMLRNIDNLQFIIGTFMYRECQLLEDYDEVLPQLPTREQALAYPPAPEFCTFMPRRG